MVSNKNESLLTDQRLVKAVLDGVRLAFGQLIRQTERLVAQLTYKLVSNPSDRKDIAQDIYLKVYKNIGSFKFRSKLSTWVGQITYNTCLHYLEKKKLVLLGNFQSELDQPETHLADAENRVEEVLFAKELAGILDEEIDRLQPLYRTLISLYHQQELSYSEIAVITSLPEGTVKSYIFRARKTLKENILSKYKRNEL